MSLVSLIKSFGIKVGIAVKPGTNIQSVLDYVPHLDQVLVMTVEPGFGGQKLMVDMLEKVSFLRSKFPGLNIQVDGGIGPDNIDLVASAGANVIVSGTGIFGAKNPEEAISIMRSSVNRFIAKSSSSSPSSSS